MVPSCNGKPSGVYLDQNRPNCQFFYTCRDQRVFNPTRCPGTLRFNQFEGRCQPAQYVKCSLSSSTSLSLSSESPTRFITTLFTVVTLSTRRHCSFCFLAILLLSILTSYYQFSLLFSFTSYLSCVPFIYTMFIFK